MLLENCEVAVDPIILIQSLKNPALYNHPVTHIKVIETHISWVILTGQYAYKIKKPVNFDFLDFTTLEKRRFYCEEEVRLNKRLAPDVYLDVVKITGSAAAPHFSESEDDPAIEYAVKMREFSQHALLSELAMRDQLTPALITEIADIVAHFHHQATICPHDKPYASPEEVFAPVQQNFDQMYPLLQEKNDIHQLEKLEAWAQQQYQKLYTIFQNRKKAGKVREAHGDLHLGNIVLIDKKPIIFDCIEFNKEFLWIDVMADIGFLMMDLEHKHRPDLAYLLINRYLQRTADYAGLQVLRFYQAYRAIVRAKVTLFHLQSPGLTASEQQTLKEHYQGCIELADRYRQTPKPWMIITHGVSCSGKSSLSRYLSQQAQAIHITSDVERKRLFGLSAEAKTLLQQANVYSAETTARTYQRLFELTELIVKAGYPIIVDATFLKKSQRDVFHEFAKTLQIPFVILQTSAPAEKLRHWIADRQKDDQEYSEAVLEILERQLKTIEPITETELQHTMTFKTAEEAAFKDVDWLIPKLYKFVEL